MTLGRRFRPLLPVLLIAVTAPATAEGPLNVGGPPFSAQDFPNGIPNSVPGVPFRWNASGFPLTYWTDQGTLGALTNTQANDLVEQAFEVWNDVETASITFSRGGSLIQNVTVVNYLSVENAIYDCSTLPGPPAGGNAQPRTIVYDSNGSITDDLFGPGQSDLVLGFANAVCFTSDGVENSYNRGISVLNGKDVNSPADTVDLKAVMIHEFGHMIGLDHSQLNVECLSLFGCTTAAALEGLPTMFPFLVDGEAMSTPSLDDIAGLSQLYPETVNDPANGKVVYETTTGVITGHILFSDGATPAEGFNVVARAVDDPATPSVDESKSLAVSNVSGYLFTGDAGNPISQFAGFTPSPFGSRDTSLLGFYYIPGLPPGNYTVEIEAVDESFTGGSGVGPIGAIGIQFPMPGTCPDGDSLDASESANDVCTDSTPVTVTAGATLSTGTDITINGTGPRYDAWEDGP